MENSEREQVNHVKTLEIQNSAVSSQFMGLVKQYAAILRPVAATDRSLQNHLKLFDAEIQNGDVLRLLQLFPALLEVYISTCSNNSKQDLPNDVREPQWRRRRSISSANSTKKKPHHQHVEMATSTWQPPTHDAAPSKTSSPPAALDIAATRKSHFSIAAKKEEDQLAEQLELIRGAFQNYKEDVRTDR